MRENMIAELHLAFTAAFACLLWTVQVVVYPQFRNVGAERFIAFHRNHTRRITWLAGPLMLGEGAFAAIFAWRGFGDAPAWHAVSLGLFIAVTGSTFLLFAPLHRRLSDGADARRIERLIRLNGLRSGLESARVAAALVLAGGGG